MGWGRDGVGDTDREGSVDGWVQMFTGSWVIILSQMLNLVGKKVKEFKIIRILGAGQSSTVFQAMDEKNELRAIKVTYLRKFKLFPKLKQQFETEVNVLKNCKNPNVISFIDSFQYHEFIFVVTEFCNGGSVDQYLLVSELTEDQALAFLRQILNGFKGLHEVGAMHRDFKAANVLLHNGICKIADLGSSKQMRDSTMAKSFLGTPLTNAPEILQREPYNFNADIWSIGILFYQMLYGKYPYLGNTQATLLQDIFSRRPNYQGFNISEEAKDFIQRCLIADPQKRIHWNQIYQHPLIIGKPIKSITSSTLQNRISINKNHQFYSYKNLQQFQKNLSSIQNLTLSLSSHQNHTQILNSEDLETIISMTELLDIADSIKKKEEIKERFDSLYVGKRNDLMFFCQFVHPYIGALMGEVRGCHGVLGFLLGKKAYLEMSRFYQGIVDNRVIFYGQSGFDQYMLHDNYRKIGQQVKSDLQTIQKLTQQYKSSIKLTTLQISQQLTLKQTKSHSLDNLIHELLSQYIKLLLQHLDQVKQQHVKILVRLIYTLEYYRDNGKIYSQEFDRIISMVNLGEVQKKLRSKGNKGSVVGKGNVL